ncbi:hypothetical protein [Amycolatopsis sp. cmx-11-12]|uniref:hypothetical protein n=1 Tax=Amycolatopsis sp. cmx-11-12 TaxID=2785795 RepID=UPI003917C9E6
MAERRDLSLVDRLTSWDAKWYLQIAEHGYFGLTGTVDAAGRPYPDAPMGFFPLYPGIIKALSHLGLSPVAAGLGVSTLAGIAASCGLLLIGRRVGDDRVSLILATLWAGSPMSITQSMVYTESLFVAFAVWALIGVLDHHWVAAGICTMLAGLARSTATILVVVVVAAAAIAAVRHRAERWPAVASAMVAPLGLLGYWGFVASRTGTLTSWQEIEFRGWGVRFDGGAETVGYVRSTLTRESMPFELLVVIVTIGAVALALLSVINRVPWPLAAYGCGVLILAIGTAGFPFMRARFLLPAFPLLLPIAVGLARRRTATAVATAATFALAGCWYSAYSLTVWQYAI